MIKREREREKTIKVNGIGTKVGPRAVNHRPDRDPGAQDSKWHAVAVKAGITHKAPASEHVSDIVENSIVYVAASYWAALETATDVTIAQCIFAKKINILIWLVCAAEDVARAARQL